MAGRSNYPMEGFAGRLHDVWIRSNMTQKEVAYEIGWERKTVRGWLYGDRIPNALALARLCRLFGVSVDYLLFGKK